MWNGKASRKNFSEPWISSALPGRFAPSRGFLSHGVFKHIDHKGHKEDAGYDARVSMARPLSVSRYF